MAGKLAVYGYISDGQHEEIVAARSKMLAVKILNTSLYQLSNYGLDYDADDDASILALSKPGTVFTKRVNEKTWRQKNAPR